VDGEKKVAVIRDDHPSVGRERIQKREDEHLHVCLKAIKGLNYPTTHEKSQAARLAQVNKKLLEMEKNATLELSATEILSDDA